MNPPSALRAALCAALLALTGCAALLPGADPVTVHAERATRAAVDTMDFFLKWEFENREPLRTIDPRVFALAESIRRDAPGWIAATRAATKAWKTNRATADRARLAGALARVEGAATEAISLIQTHQPPPP